MTAAFVAAETISSAHVEPDDYAGTLIARMEMKITEKRLGYVRGVMPVRGNRQPVGVLHGGASAAFAETLGSLAAWEFAGYGAAVGTELSCTHHRWVADGVLVGVATPIHEGRSTATYAIAITDADGRVVCSARLTCALRRRRGSSSGR